MENKFKGKKRIAIIAVTIIFFATAILIYHYYIKPSSGLEPEKEVPANAAMPQKKSTLNVNAIIVKTQTLIDDITTVGNLIPDEEVDLSFETSGKITAINFQEGSVVKKGDVLAKVNDQPLKAQLSRYEAQVKLAEDRVFRQNILLEKDAVSKEAYEQATTDLAMLKADIAIVNSNIALTELRAPFDGVIGLRNVSEGAYASPSVVIAKLTKISPLKIDMYLPERYSSFVSIGTPLTFTVEGINKEFNAIVYAKESKVDVETRTIAVRALYPNTYSELQPGRFVAVKIRMHKIDDAIAIPTEAIVPEMGVDKVFVYRSGKVHSIPVTSGLRTEALIQVVEGLNIGDTVVTSGTLQLRESLPVVLDSVE